MSARSRSCIEATKDPDWWVSERAVDALAEIGSTKSLPRFIEMLGGGEPKSLPTVIRAIGKIGDQKCIEHLLPHAAAAGKRDQGRRRSRRSPSSRTSGAPTPSACGLQAVAGAAPMRTVSQAVARAMQELDNRFSTQQIAANQRAEKMQEPAKTLLIDNQDLAKVVQEHEVADRASWISPR